MSIEDINYDIFIEKAMRDVVKLALKKAQKIKNDNLCFLFVLDTKNKNLLLPSYLKKQYPEEITLILQHQFSNLNVKSSSFSVDLSFSGKIEHLKIPFSSMKVFYDKMAGIELNFNYFKSDDLYIYDDEDFDEDYFLNDDFSNINNNLINFSDLRSKKNDN